MNRKISIFLISLLIIISSFYFLQCLVMPKYMTGVVEGAFIEEYYKSNKDHDVLFLGDCETYGNFDPLVLWDEYGINSYIRGSAQQLTWQSYYILEDTLRYEKPDVVVFTVSPLKHNEPQHEAYNRMTLDGMEWSMSKVNSIIASMLDEETFLDYLLPLFRYHGRWNELTMDDFTYLLEKEYVSQNGYYLRTDINPLETVPNKPILSDYTLGDNAMLYLDKMYELCQEHDIEFVLIKAPSVYPHWYDEWDEQIYSYIEDKDIEYLNFTPLVEEIGIDYHFDTYDKGLHLNQSGANKLTDYFGNYLVEQFGLENRQDEIDLIQYYEELTIRYQKEVLKQDALYKGEEDE